MAGARCLLIRPIMNSAARGNEGIWFPRDSFGLVTNCRLYVGVVGNHLVALMALEEGNHSKLFVYLVAVSYD